jgi:hypothetical protein
LSFTAIVQTAEFILTDQTTEPTKLTPPFGSDDITFLVETNDPDQVITGVGIRWGINEIDGLSIKFMRLNDDGTLSDPQFDISGSGDSSILIEAQPNEVVVGIGLAFDGTTAALLPQNMLELHFRTIDPETKALSSEVRKERIGPTTRLPELEFTFPNHPDRILTGLGVSTELPNIGPDGDPGSFKRDILALRVGHRKLNPQILTPANRPKQLTLTDTFQDIGETFPVNTPNLYYYLSTLIPNSPAELSFHPTQHITFQKNPTGHIYARTQLQRSNSAKTFGIDPPKVTQNQPLAMIDDAQVTRRYTCYSYNDQDYDIKYCPSGTIAGFDLHKARPGDTFFGDSNFGIGLTTQRYYCTKDGLWVSDLDQIETHHTDLEGDACKDARDLGPGTQALPYLWTGTQCCGDDNDENYNDRGLITAHDELTQRRGACFDAFGFEHLEFVDPEDEQVKDVIVWNGTMLGCKIDGSKNTANDVLLTLQDPAGGPLINNTDYCTFVEDTENPSGSKSLYCSFQEEWLESGAEKVMHLRTIRFPSEDNFIDSSECCPTDKCWNGLSCVAHESQKDIIIDKPEPQPDEQQKFFCFHGEWKTAEENIFKFTPNRQTKSLNCEPEQCFLDAVTPDGCVDPGFIQNDFICQDGNWSTRTRMIAEAMLQVADNEFTLYCDSYDKVLNYFTYNYLKNTDLPLPGTDTIESRFLDATSIPGECEGKTTKMINNICILNNGPGEVLFGVSYNCPVTAQHHNILDVFGKDASHCQTLANTPSAFKLCTNHKPGIHKPGFAYYNTSLNSLIFSPSFNPGSALTGNQGTCNVQSPFPFLDLFHSYNYLCWSRLLINTFTNPNQKETLRSFIESVKDIRTFNKLYLSKAEDRAIFGVMQLGLHDEIRGPINYVSLYFDGFVANICGLVSSIIGEDSQDLSCIKKGSTVQVASADDSLSKIFEDEIWNQFTAKTRIKKIDAGRCYQDGCNGIVPPQCNPPTPGFPPDPDLGTAYNNCCGLGKVFPTDPDCAPSLSGESFEFNCQDSLDNDGDGAKDECDTGCGIVSQNVNTKQTSESICNDGLDNDCDGLVDLAESNCAPITMNPDGGDLITGETQLITALPSATGTYTWGFVENDDGECTFDDQSLTKTTTTNTVNIFAAKLGNCRVSVTDPRGIQKQTQLFNIEKPELTCSFSNGACPPDKPHSIMKLSSQTSGLAALPNSAAFTNNICCGLSNGYPLIQSTQPTTQGLIYTLTPDQKLSVVPISDAGKTEQYLSNTNNHIECSAFTSQSGGILPQASSCESVGFEECLFSTSQPEHGNIADCNNIQDLPVKMCCKVLPSGAPINPTCPPPNRRCVGLTQSQICVNGQFVNEQTCAICIMGFCII